MQTGNKPISNNFLIHHAPSRNTDHAYSMQTPQNLAKAAEVVMSNTNESQGVGSVAAPPKISRFLHARKRSHQVGYRSNSSAIECRPSTLMGARSALRDREGVSTQDSTDLHTRAYLKSIFSPLHETSPKLLDKDVQEKHFSVTISKPGQYTVANPATLVAQRSLRKRLKSANNDHVAKYLQKRVHTAAQVAARSITPTRETCPKQNIISRVLKNEVVPFPNVDTF